MDSFFFVMQGVAFRDGISALTRSYNAALGGLRSEVAKAWAEAESYRRSIADGAPEEIVCDEDGNMIADRSYLLDLEIDNANAAVDALCKAYAVAFYHHWERSIRSLTRTSPHAKHDSLVAEAAELGIEADPGLSKVRNLANTLKHANEKWGQALLETWPETFPPLFRNSRRADWYSAIRLREDHIEEAIQILLASGPQTLRRVSPP